MWGQMREQYIYEIGALLLCVFLTAGLLELLGGERTAERKRPQPGGRGSIEIEQGTAEQKKPEQKESDRIRVLIKTDGFKKTEHAKAELWAKGGLTVRCGGKTKECDSLDISPDDPMLREGSITAEPKDQNEKIEIRTLKRGYGTPSYRGTLEIYPSKKGVILVNELPIEQYLYAVVPSEMPASYELEALKAQAVCARSYAVKQTRTYSYPEYKAHVDDSTAFQVYGNSGEKERAVRAVNETAGEKVWHGKEIATTYYFSTSGGVTTGVEAWGRKPGRADAYLKSVKVKNEKGDYERTLPWYRWTAEIDGKLLEKQIARSTKKDIGRLKEVKVTKRGPGNVAVRLVASGDKGSVTVSTENKIRRVFGGSGCRITKQDGTKASAGELLPSAFFTIRKKGTAYVIRGGGYGHGIGMSQNGANEMAKAGKTYREILGLFYQKIEVRK